MNKFVVLFLAGLSLMITSAGADTLTSGNYTINDTIPCGGQTLNSGTYTIYDLKGQAAAGVLTSGTYTVQLGGIYGLVGAGAVGPATFTITRKSNDDLVLSWTGATPDIYYMNGNGSGQFVNTYSSSKWPKVVPGTANTFSAISNNSLTVYAIAATAFPEMYFKAVPAGMADLAGANASVFAKAPTVGRLEVDVPKNGGRTLLGLPFYAGKVSNIFLGQLGTNSLTLLPRSGGGLDYVTVTNTAVVGLDFDVNPTVGFWMVNPNASDVTITFVGGLVSSSTGALTSNLLNLDLTGNPLPVSFPSSSLGINDDIILPQNGNGLDYFTRNIANGAATPWGPNFTTVKLGAGFWYKSASNRRWNINTVAPSAVIEQY